MNNDAQHEIYRTATDSARKGVRDKVGDRVVGIAATLLGLFYSTLAPVSGGWRCVWIAHLVADR
jgi:hypothetical protein